MKLWEVGLAMLVFSTLNYLSSLAGPLTSDFFIGGIIVGLVTILGATMYSYISGNIKGDSE